jgi:prepilin-type N-terminal cleavage/methylation domain-containing protein
MRRKRGFTLYEALIALAIAGISLAAIFELQRSLVDGQRRHEAALRAASLRRDALAMIRDINPDVTPEGDIILPPDKEMRWIATPITEQKLSAGFPTGDGRYYVTLYSVAVEVTDAEGRALDSFDVERMGWTSQAQAAAGLTGVAPAPVPAAVP